MRLSIKPGYMLDVTSMPMSSPMISRMFGRADFALPAGPGSFTACADAVPAASAASTANPRNAPMTALWITVSSPRFVVIFNDTALLHSFHFAVNSILASHKKQTAVFRKHKEPQGGNQHLIRRVELNFLK